MHRHLAARAATIVLTVAALAATGLPATAGPATPEPEAKLTLTHTYVPNPEVGVETRLDVDAHDGKHIVDTSAHGSVLYGVVIDDTDLDLFHIVRATPDGSETVRRLTRPNQNSRAVVAAAGPTQHFEAIVDDTTQAGLLTNTDVVVYGPYGGHVLSGPRTGDVVSQEVFLAGSGMHATLIRHYKHASGDWSTEAYRHGVWHGFRPVGIDELAPDLADFDLKVAPSGTAAFAYTHQVNGHRELALGTLSAEDDSDWIQSPAPHSIRPSTNAAIDIVDDEPTAFWGEYAYDGTVRLRSAVHDAIEPHWVLQVDADYRWPTGLGFAFDGFDQDGFAVTRVAWERHDGSALRTGLVVQQNGHLFGPGATGSHFFTPLSYALPLAGPTPRGGTNGLVVGPKSSSSTQTSATAWTLAPDVVAPEVTQTVVGNALTLDATDLNGATNVECTLSHQPRDTDAPLNWLNAAAGNNSCAWDSTGVQTGTYTLTGTFADKTGNQTVATSVTTVSAAPDVDPPVTNPPVVTPPVTTPPVVKPKPFTVTTSAARSTLRTGDRSATWKHTTNVKAPRFDKELTLYTPAKKVLRVHRWRTGKTVTTRKVPNGATACLRVRVPGSTGWTKASCQTSRLDDTNSKYLTFRGATSVTPYADRTGRTVTGLLPDSKNPGRVTLKVAKGATIRIKSAGTGTARISVPGTKAVLMTGRTARTRTFTAAKSGTVTIVRDGADNKTKPFSIDDLVIRYR